MKLINTKTGKEEFYKDFETINLIMSWPKNNRKTEIGIWKVIEEDEKPVKKEVSKSDTGLSFLFDELDEFWKI